jgi:hypothetical protein
VGRRESNFNQQPSETSNLVQKVEGIENSQAEEKDKLEISNKNLNNRFNDLEKMMKSMMNQSQHGTGGRREQIEQYSPNNGVKLGQPGTISRWGPPSNKRNGNFVDNGCYYCGSKGHYIPDCEELKHDLRTGYVTQNSDGRLRNGEGGFISNNPVGANIKEKVEKQKMMKQSQFYGDYDRSEYIAKPVIPMYPASL